MEKEILQKTLNENTDKLIEAINSCSFNNSFFRIPNDNSWSVAKIAKHLFLLESLITNVILGPAESAPFDDSNEKKRLIEFVFQNHEKKLLAPELTVPKGSFLTQEEALGKIKEKRLKVEQVIKDLPLEMICLGFEHRFFGKLSREDWIYFIIIHCERHIIQIQKRNDF